MKRKNKIIFFGTPKFGSLILERLISEKFNIVTVVTKKDKPAGRGQKIKLSPVKKVAIKENIPVLQPEKIKKIKDELKKIKPTLAIVAAYGQIIPKKILEIPEYGFLNIHPSLLPKYRGPTPIRTAILNGDKKTGVSVILMDEKMDHGSIVAQEEIPLNTPTYEELFEKLTKKAKDLIVKVIPKWINKEIKPEKQNHSKASYTTLLKKEDGRINWNKKAVEIDRKIRAYNPWPSTFTFFKGKMLKILEAEIVKQDTFSKREPGKVLDLKKEKLIVQTGKDLLRLKKIKPEGKKEMKDKDFLKGHKEIIGKILE